MFLEGASYQSEQLHVSETDVDLSKASYEKGNFREKYLSHCFLKKLYNFDHYQKDNCPNLVLLRKSNLKV